MNKLNRLLIPCLKTGTLSLLLLNSVCLRAETVRVAVASNFSATLLKISKSFEEGSQHRVLISSASTGKHYAQIKQGAPFDVFLAADSERPRRLVSDGFVEPQHRFTYAVGRLVLWSYESEAVGIDSLMGIGQKKLAMANPDLAPYGRAAMDFIVSAGLKENLESNFVMGENIGHAMQYVATGNAALGLLAYSQIVSLKQSNNAIGEGGYWLIPSDRHAPIKQDAVLLNNTVGAKDFFNFLKSEPVKQIIRESGYETP